MRAEGPSISAPEINADQVIAAALKRTQKRKAAVQAAKKGKKTPTHKQTHAVNNETVHELNNSAQQADSRQEIDRDSEQTTTWQRPSILAAPDPRPGYAQRWGRYRAGGSDDSDNLDKLIEQGWQPRKRASAKMGHELTSDRNSKYGLYYVKRGLILMEIPLKLAQQRDNFYKGKQSRMTESIDQDMFKLNNPLMPLLKPSRKTRVTTTARRGRLDDNIPGDDEE